MSANMVLEQKLSFLCSAKGLIQNVLRAFTDFNELHVTP